MANTLLQQPPNALGGDLIWWRAADGWRTIVTLVWAYDDAIPDSITLQMVLLGKDGEPLHAWDAGFSPNRPIFIDSAADGTWREFAQQASGLAIFAMTNAPASDIAKALYKRMYPFVDWHGPDGSLATLHSDQCLRAGSPRRIDLTEVVIIEDESEHNYLVYLNGSEPQQVGALTLRAKNSSGEIRQAVYANWMAPFTVHRIAINDMFPDAQAFSGNAPLLIEGEFDAHGVFSRPYVETAGSRAGTYHAGDIYRWSELPYAVHLMNGGEVNPMAVICNDSTQTFVNLLHSHGSLRDDIAVDAVLYNDDGKVVSSQQAWRIARRDGLARANIAELLPHGLREFHGHVALTFSPQPWQPVPRRLQALMEYRRAASVARIMAWSDEWNSPVKLATRGIDTPVRSSFCRVLESDAISTEVTITNPGHAKYTFPATVVLRLVGPVGDISTREVTIAPYATLRRRICDLFPEAMEVLGPKGLGILIAESQSDLANVAFTSSKPHGTLAAEHFLVLQGRDEAGQWIAVAGS